MREEESAGSESTMAETVSGSGDLAGLRRLTELIAASEVRRTAVIGQLRRQGEASWEDIGRACGMTRQGAARRWSRQLQATAFGDAVDAYERGRPTYPPSCVDWLIPRRAKRVLELGAGTGKLTRLLTDTGVRVVAVEPSAPMRQRLLTEAPAAVICDGSAERIPLPDASVDAVVAAQAWHWFDPTAAVPEIARVLAPGGTLALVWNVRDDTVPWVAELGDIMHQHAPQTIDTEPDLGPPFERPERSEIRWEQVLTRAELLELVASRSYVITLPEDRREELLREVELFLDKHPELGERIALPYVTRCTRTRVR